VPHNERATSGNGGADMLEICSSDAPGRLVLREEPRDANLLLLLLLLLLLRCG
jgi:hypothetical protein